MKKEIWKYSIVFCIVLSLITCNMSITTVHAGNTANELVAVAKRELGNDYSKYTQYVGSIGGRYDYPWCAAFVSWCGNQAGVSCIGKTASCKSQYDYMLSHGAKRVDTPQAGDVVFFYCNSCRGVQYQWCHIGIMINSNTSIDGNYGNRVAEDRSYSHKGSLGVKHGTGKIYVRPNYGQTTSMLPGTVDSSWSVPANVTASHKIATYDQWGNAESNHYIDPGDKCYVAEVYTNGFVKVQYPVSGGTRWAYAKASDFSLSKKQENTLPSTKLHAWYSLTPMGSEVSSIRYNDLVYLCYRLETQDGKLLDSSIGNYTVKETLYKPDGSSVDYTYNNNNNWISCRFASGGNYRGVVQISGDYTGSVEVSLNLQQPYKVLFDTWFSATPMGSKIGSMEKGKEYYYCFSLVANERGYYNQSINTEYKVTQNLYSPDGKKIGTWSKDKTDHNCIKFTASQTGNYKSITTMTGMPYGTIDDTCICKDTTKLESIGVSKYPARTTYTVGESLSTSGMVVTAKYSDGKTKNVTGYKVTGGSTAKVGKNTVTISYSEGGITKTASFVIQVNEAVHKYGEWSVAKRATCTTSGAEERKCTTCGRVETRTVNATGHKYVNKVVEPTTTQKGYTIHTCSVCGYSYKDNYTNVQEQTVKKDVVSITYDTNGGSISQTTQSGTKGSTIQILKERPTKKVNVVFNSNGGNQNPDSVSLQQSFMRWVYTSAAGENGYYPGDSLQLTENRTLRAQYSAAKLTALPVVQRNGYTFGGWYTANNKLAYEGMTITADTVLTARWTQQTPATSEDQTSQTPTTSEDQSQNGNTSGGLNWSDIVDDDDVEEPEDDSDDEELAVGDEYATDQAIYTITKMNDDYCVEYSEMFDDDVEETYIPDTIAINGTVYKVTSVGEKAFYKNQNLKRIVISGYVERIDAKAFYGCTSLKGIAINTTKIKSGQIGANAFKKVNKNVSVYVPSSKYKAYKKMMKKAGIGAKAQIYKMKNL